jgi:hypothetical protein
VHAEFAVVVCLMADFNLWNGVIVTLLTPVCLHLQDEISPSEAYEHSELLAYKAMVHCFEVSPMNCVKCSCSFTEFDSVSLVLALSPLQDEISPSEAYEHSELLAYKAMVLQEGGQAEAALALLEQQQVSKNARCGKCSSAVAGGGKWRQPAAATATAAAAAAAPGDELAMCLQGHGAAGGGQADAVPTLLEQQQVSAAWRKHAMWQV